MDIIERYTGAEGIASFTFKVIARPLCLHIALTRYTLENEDGTILKQWHQDADDPNFVDRKTVEIPESVKQAVLVKAKQSLFVDADDEV